jgi:hypothetical protein
MKTILFACALAVCVAAAGCVGYQNKTTVPTGPTAAADTVTSLMGNWQSISGAGIIPSPSSCTDFKWNPTELTATSAKGSFSANCAGDLKVSGTAMGTLNGTLNAGTVTWSAAGTASTPTIPSCGITLTGTAELGVNSIRIPYNGTTCLGPVSGVEVLARK